MPGCDHPALSGILASRARGRTMTTKGHAGPGRPPIDPDVALFAALLRKDERDRAAVERHAAEQREQAEAAAAERRRREDLQAAKDDAARRLKDARRRGDANAISQAEASYKLALADLLAAETGERPEWAPPPAAVHDDEPAAVEVEGNEAAAEEGEA
jgi:hypothetical protein